MKESLQNKVHLEDVPLRAFKLLMTYIYTGQLPTTSLEELDEGAVLELMKIVDLYGIESLQKILRQYLKKKLTIENVCTIFDRAEFLHLEELSDACQRFIIDNAGAFLKSGTFEGLSATALIRVLSQDAFSVVEIEIFRAFCRWCSSHSSEIERSNVLGTIRLSLITTQDLVTIVRDSRLVSPDLILDAILERKTSKGMLKHRTPRTIGFGLFD